MTESQKKNYDELSPLWLIPYEKKFLDYGKIFGNNNPVTIEIGFGMGQATAEIAQKNPEKNYIGIEVHKPGVGKLLGEIKMRELKNLRIVEYDALEVFANMIEDDSVDAIHVFFPDPWPKKRHHKRRLVQKANADLFSKKLKPGGYFYMATDWEEYAESALCELNATNTLRNKYEKFAPRQAWRPETKFERKGVAERRAVYELYFIKPKS